VMLEVVMGLITLSLLLLDLSLAVRLAVGRFMAHSPSNSVFSVSSCLSRTRHVIIYFTVSLALF